MMHPGPSFAANGSRSVGLGESGAGARLPEALASILACPRCHKTYAALGASLVCEHCGPTGRIDDGVPDFVDQKALGDQHHEEMDAQEHAVGEYYENERKLSCHWDRLSAMDLPAMMGGTLGRILDLGCGTGNAGDAFMRAGATVIGADLSVPCVRVAQTRLSAVVRADAVALPFADGAFDGVVARGALHHIADPDRTLAEARRVVRPGGRGLFIEPRAFPWLEPIKHVIRKSDHAFSDDHHAFGVREYRAMITAHFEVEEVFTIHPFAILFAVGLDLFPLPRLLPFETITRGLLDVDRRLNKTPAAKAGHLIVVRARRA
jgi:ubiquinone/menaquinone biosynthesis C-methylase UbiE